MNIKGKLTLIWSFILDFENQANPYQERKDIIARWEEYSNQYITESKDLLKKAKELVVLGLKSKDALHIASAISAKCEYFITTDNGIIKKIRNLADIHVMNPLSFIAELEEIL